jgi:glycosyltransferase involved in cell wall biosynthesis
MKRFLFVTYHFPPSVGGGIPRAVSFARDVPQYGWCATVLTSTSHGAAAVDASALEGLPPEARVVRAYCPLARAGTRGHERVVHGLKGAIRRTLARGARLAMVPELFAPWIPFAYAAGRRALAAEPHDAIVATYGPPANLVVGSALARASGLPLLLDFRDLWTDLPFARFASPGHAAVLRALERRIITSAAGVTTVSDGMSDHLRARFDLPPERVVTIVNGFDEAALAYVRDDRTAPGRPFTLCYSGSVYTIYDVEPLLGAIRRLADAGKVTPETFRFRTLGNFPSDLVARAGIAGFHDREGFVPKRAMFERFADVDAFVAVESGEYGARMGYPVKVFDYLLTGKPILGIVVPGGNCARLLADMGMMDLPENREDAIADRLLAILATRGRKPGVVRIDQPPLSRFRRDHNARALAALLDSVTGAEPTRYGAVAS